MEGGETNPRACRMIIPKKKRSHDYSTLSWSANFEPEFDDIALQIALSTICTLTARNVRLTHMTIVRIIRVRYHSTKDKEVMNLSRGAGPGYDPFVQVTKGRPNQTVIA